MKRDRVIFRQFKNTNDVIAFLLDQPASEGYVVSYMSVGQHSEANYNGLLSKTKPITLLHPAVIHLWGELECLGYKLTTN
mgnify:CR=1 FL=1